MSPAKRKKAKPTDIGDYQHKKQLRKNNPAAGLAKGSPPTLANRAYSSELDPHDSPVLLFKYREKTDMIQVDTVPLHVHESVHPSVILASIAPQTTTLYDYDIFENTRPHNEAIDFYKHEDGWTNRLVTGDSLLVMNSLLEKENMAGRVQMIYFDPPYGIKYNSNFQPRIFDPAVKDNPNNIEMRPEPIKAFRDTWELEIHSYLAMVRKRLLLAHKLLNESGSIFIQISTENQHLVRVLLDEIFGRENFMWQVLFRTKPGGGVGDRPNPYDHILWYAKNKENAKFNRLWVDRTDESIKKIYKHIQLRDNIVIAAPLDGKLPRGSRFCKLFPLHSQGVSTTDRSKPHTFPNGKKYSPPDGKQWALGHDAMDELYHKNRIHFTPNSASFIGYPEDSPHILLNIWDGRRTSSKIYAVETKPDIVQNCMLMCSDVGDLVLDITAGSGTTTFVAEQWGRRWIACDTSRVSLATIRYRLQTAVYFWYKLASNTEGVCGGFEYYEQIRKTPESLSKDKSEIIIRYDKPKTEKNKSRVTGPFTVEAIPAPTVTNMAKRIPVRRNWISMMEKSGIKTENERLTFDTIEKNEDETSPIHVYGTAGGKKFAISFGPEHGPMGRYQVDHVLAESEKDVTVLFAALAFDPVAKSIIDKTRNARSVLINNDVLISDLRSQSSDQPFSMVGEPDIKISKNGKKYVVELLGYDYYVPSENRLVTGNTKNVAMWLLDTDYDGRTLRVKQLFFPDRPDLWKELERSLQSAINPDLLAMYSGTRSIPFEIGNHKRIAVKVIDMNGNESLKVDGLEKWQRA